MKNMNIAIIMAAAATSAASAGVVDVQYLSLGAGSDIQLHMGMTTHDTFAGELNHEMTNAMGADAYLNGLHRTFCPDLSQAVSASSAREYFTTEIENIPLAGGGIVPMGAQKADAIRALYSASASTLLAGGLTNAYATAFQLVIWEIVDDFDGSASSIDVDAGAIIVTNTMGGALDMDILAAIDALTTDMMTALGNGGASFDGVIGLANESYQDQLVVVPAPGAMALLGLGGLMTTRRRRSN